MGKIAQIIKYEGDNSTFIWKHPCEDFNFGSQLIVHESQEAIFFLNGQALDLFGPGRHTLEAQNIPKLGKTITRLTGGDTPFHCEVYFINKTVQMSIKWGTLGKIRFIEPSVGLPIEIGAHGELNLEVADARTLLVKLVGTMDGIAWGDGDAGFTKSLQECFRPLISNAVKAHLPSEIKEQNIDILEIDQHLESLSKGLCKKISAGFEEYGLTIPQIYITDVLLPDDKDENFRKFRDLHTYSFQTKAAKERVAYEIAEAELAASLAAAEGKAELERAKIAAERKIIAQQAEAQAMKMTGMAEAEVMAAKGYTERDVLAADVQKAYAEGIGNMTINGGAGGAAGDMIGLGVGMAAAGVVAPQLGEMFKGMNPSAVKEETIKCGKCGATISANAKFCMQCGEKIVSESEVVCPECGKTVAKGKFCAECGYKFITSCPKCGKEVPAGSKFCLECGEKF